MLTGEFNFKEVKSDDYATKGGENVRGNKLLKLITDTLMTQCVQGNTRLRGVDESRQLIFTKTWSWMKESIMNAPQERATINFGKMSRDVSKKGKILQWQTRLDSRLSSVG